MAMTVNFSGGTPRYQFQWLTAVNKWADTVGPLVLTEMKAKAPVASGPNASTGNHKAGTLRNKIRYSRTNTPGTLTIEFTGYAPYTGFVVNGTKPHQIRPVKKRFLHFYESGGTNAGADVFIGPKGDKKDPHVNHPGYRGNPFPTRVMESMAPEAQRLFNEIMMEALGGGE
jgi:hypothetical protein